MSGRYSASRLQAAAIFALAVGAVPADPTITSPALLPRQNDAQFIGFVEQSGTWYSETCDPGGTWYQNGNYAQCCPTTLASCYAPTACVRGTLIFPVPDRSTTISIACTENFPNQTPAASICNTAFIFENFGDSNPKTDIVCGPSSVNWSYYRKIPASATAVSSQPPSSLQQPAPASSGLGSLSTNNNDSSDKGGGSKAWIAGAVIGPIVGLALIGLLVFCCLRRKKKNKHAALQQGSASMAQVHPNQLPAGVAGHTEAKPQPQQSHYNQADPYINAGLNAGTAATQGGYSNPSSPPPMTQNYIGMPPQNTGGAAYNTGTAPYSPGAAPYNAGTASYNTSPVPYNAGPAPYTAPVSPPPQQSYSNDVKHQYMATPQGQATGDPTSGQKTHTAELSGSAAGTTTAPSELPSGKTTWVDTLTNL